MAPKELNVLVLQGGGALGAYQAGAFERLAKEGFDLDWVAGISIGAINAALICGNPPERRVKRLRTFWERVSANLALNPLIMGQKSRRAYAQYASAVVSVTGAPGFFVPRNPLTFWPWNPVQPLSYYDTSPLFDTLTELVDFTYLNDSGPRISVEAVDLETGNFTNFDSSETRIGPEHIMASGALPPGFPPVEVDGRLYWDGGLVSNTPLQYVMEHAATDPMCIFQIDLFSANGPRPENIAEVEQRLMDVRFSSRTRLTTDRFRQLHDIRAAADRLAEKLPKELQSDPDLAFLRASGPHCPVTIAHLIHRKEGFESGTKDYEFSRMTMAEHWAIGMADVKHTLSHDMWKTRQIGVDGLQVFDLGGAVPSHKGAHPKLAQNVTPIRKGATK
ncbi:patatin-like phospholipase family protein [Phaeovulum sp.]|uniref:patatin-like phospholipase family protein n=1 Tax=Phaeovulum sp. TaxID=2934796 RepID=UPI0039E5C5EB